MTVSPCTGRTCSRPCQGLPDDPVSIPDTSLLVNTLNAGNMTQFVKDFETFAVAWATVSDVDLESGSDFVDARPFETPEAMYGTDFAQFHRSANRFLTDPGNFAGPLIELQREEFIGSVEPV